MGEVELVCAGLQLEAGHNMAKHIHYFEGAFPRQLDCDSACRGIGPKAESVLCGFGYACIPTVVGCEELVYLGHVTDVVLLFAVVPGVVTADDFDVLKGCVALIGVAYKAQTVVATVGEGIDNGLTCAVVSGFPIIKYGLYAEAEISTKIL